MRRNFTVSIHADGCVHVAVILPAMKRNGLHYEVNIAGLPRFLMRYGALGRYEVMREEARLIPDAIALAVSDAIEETERNNFR